VSGLYLPWRWGVSFPPEQWNHDLQVVRDINSVKPPESRTYFNQEEVRRDGEPIAATMRGRAGERVCSNLFAVPISDEIIPGIGGDGGADLIIFGCRFGVKTISFDGSYRNPGYMKLQYQTRMSADELAGAILCYTPGNLMDRAPNDRWVDIIGWICTQRFEAEAEEMAFGRKEDGYNRPWCVADHRMTPIDNLLEAHRKWAGGD